MFKIGAIPVTDGRFGKGVGPVHMSNVRCNGDEMRLLDCSHSNGVGVTNCHHGRDAGVVCEGIYRICIHVHTLFIHFAFSQKVLCTLFMLRHKAHWPLVV